MFSRPVLEMSATAKFMDVDNALLSELASYAFTPLLEPVIEQLSTRLGSWLDGKLIVTNTDLYFRKRPWEYLLRLTFKT